MCGICGIWSPDFPPQEESLRAMTDTLRHRGPDDSGLWIDRAAGIGLGHRRLSILDLSPLGRQPMRSACGRWTIAYNGEVYNHLELRRELGDYPFQSTSDTETILAAVATWGVEEAVKRFVGMFALGLWDSREQALHLVRDRLGIKPLYHGLVKGPDKGPDKGAVLFASELKALRAHPGFDNPLDRDALTQYFRHGCIPGPYSIYQGIAKLAPGTMAVYRRGQRQPELGTYWSAREVWLSGMDQPFSGTLDEAADELDGLLGDAVAKRMLSDVPLGAFLSGGVDSSTVVALMQARSSAPVKTFSIGFAEQTHDEAPYARAVAQHLGAEHTELILSAQDLLDVVPLVPRFWDEPFADSSQIPTYCVSRLARGQVTVSLSGDGGDELFAGYDRYTLLNKWGLFSRAPRALRRLGASALGRAPDCLFRLLGTSGDKARWRLDALAEPGFPEFYRNLLSHFRRPEELVPGASEPACLFLDPANRTGGDRFRQMTLWDVLGYLPDDILTKVDRASMAVGLEARVPLLDHRVVEFAATLPTDMKVRNGRGKAVLRRVLARYVPDRLVDRPKSGFAVPIQEWLGGPLRDWAESLLSPSAIRQQGVLEAGLVERMWREYLAGAGHWNFHLWDVLMFQAWLGENGS